MQKINRFKIHEQDTLEVEGFPAYGHLKIFSFLTWVSAYYKKILSVI